MHLTLRKTIFLYFCTKYANSEVPLQTLFIYINGVVVIWVNYKNYRMCRMTLCKCVCGQEYEKQGSFVLTLSLCIQQRDSSFSEHLTITSVRPVQSQYVTKYLVQNILKSWCRHSLRQWILICGPCTRWILESNYVFKKTPVFTIA